MLFPEHEAIIWRGPMLMKAIQQLLLDVALVEAQLGDRTLWRPWSWCGHNGPRPPPPTQPLDRRGGVVADAALPVAILPIRRRERPPVRTPRPSFTGLGERVLEGLDLEA